MDMKSNEVNRLYKVLSRNDTGETHSHQSGISIPRSVVKEGIFPYLGIEKLNPRMDIDLIDENGKKWTFQYIYYNDLKFGKKIGHDEYRLTCVVNYIRENGISSGDEIWFSIDEQGDRYIGFRKKDEVKTEETKPDNVVVIKLTGTWHSVKIKK